MPAAAPNPRNVERYCRTHELLNRTTTRRNFLLTGSFAILWLLLGIEPLDRNTWLLENVLLVPCCLVGSDWLRHGREHRSALLELPPEDARAQVRG